MSILLQVSHLSKSYGQHKALDDVSIDVREGSIYGLLGPNGAGKTTLIRIVNRISHADHGTVTLMGHTLNDEDINQIGYLPEERGLYKKMKVGEQAVYLARLKGMTKRDAERELHKWFEKLDMDKWWGRRVE